MKYAIFAAFLSLSFLWPNQTAKASIWGNLEHEAESAFNHLGQSFRDANCYKVMGQVCMQGTHDILGGPKHPSSTVQLRSQPPKAGNKLGQCYCEKDWQLVDKTAFATLAAFIVKYKH